MEQLQVAFFNRLSRKLTDNKKLADEVVNIPLSGASVPQDHLCQPDTAPIVSGNSAAQMPNTCVKVKLHPFNLQ